MTTTPFLGHDIVLKKLRTLFHADRLPHALLFTGPEGKGKRLVALHLAKILLCQGSPQPCGTCFSCKLEDIQTHSDLTLVEPESERIKIDSIREIKKNLSLTPMTGDTRVVLVTDAHTMNAASANALLKTLEEPPQQAFFILITHAPGWLPKTIVSRCQKIRFAEDSPPPAGSTLPFPLENLLPGKTQFNFADIHEQVQAVVEAETLLPFLDALLGDTHQFLTQKNPNPNLRFALLTFVDKIIAFQKSLRVNANPKIHLTRLLLHFQEPPDTRL